MIIVKCTTLGISLENSDAVLFTFGEGELRWGGFGMDRWKNGVTAVQLVNRTKMCHIDILKGVFDAIGEDEPVRVRFTNGRVQVSFQPWVFGGVAGVTGYGLILNADFSLSIFNDEILWRCDLDPATLDQSAE